MTLTDVLTTWVEVIIRVDSPGFWNTSQCHHKQSLSELHFPRWTYLTNLWCDSCVQSIYSAVLISLLSKWFCHNRMYCFNLSHSHGQQMIMFIDMLGWCNSTVRHVTVWSVEGRIILPVTKICKEHAWKNKEWTGSKKLEHFSNKKFFPVELPAPRFQMVGKSKNNMHWAT